VKASLLVDKMLSEWNSILNGEKQRQTAPESHIFTLPLSLLEYHGGGRQSLGFPHFLFFSLLNFYLINNHCWQLMS